MMNSTERRRLLIAAAVTVVAIPVLMISGGSDSSSDEPSTPTTVVVNSEPADPAFLPVEDSTPAPEIITVNVPAPPSGTVIKGIASFIRWPETLGLRPCATPNALIGSIITVTNLNNGRSIECNNVSIQQLPGDAVIIIHTEVFLELADLVDAPIPVQIAF
ncbi:MAG: hypothetical protein EB010_04135 [Acidimicrobiia bacterium]|jgi:hypothetical protein|nr:hypothetical protein [Actinomycetota bacterium]NDA76532.1 hypothetical protein [Actinomycetota bacterium]NDE58599.1 hypothetical protein [Acidimicrobiia bacterium]